MATPPPPTTTPTSRSASTSPSRQDARTKPQTHEYALKPLTWPGQQPVTGPVTGPGPGPGPGTRSSSPARRIAIVMQSANGPCPLLALVNVLALRGDINLRPDKQSVSYEHLADLLGNLLVQRLSSSTPAQSTQQDNELQPPDYSIDDVLATIPSLERGLDVNVDFSLVLGFELTSALRLFATFGIRLLHGWTCDSAEDSEVYQVVAEKYRFYNKVVEAIVAGDTAAVELERIDSGAATAKKDATDKAAGASQETQSTYPDDARRMELETAVYDGRICSQFLSNTASQLTYHGLQHIYSTLAPGELCVLFRNNHFSTLYKHPRDNGLFALVTDQGFVGESDVVWESLHRIDGDSVFFGANFEPFVAHVDQAMQDQPRNQSNHNDHADAGTDGLQDELQRVDRDFALALSLQEEEERVHAEYLNRQHQRQQHQQQHRSSPLPPSRRTNSSTPSSSASVTESGRQRSKENLCSVQ